MISEVQKKAAWEEASEMVNPIIDKYGLEPYRTGTFSTFTQVDQHIDQTIRVANWLLGVD